MLVTLAGIVKLAKFGSIRKALSEIVANCEPAANDTLVRPVMLWNAARPMLATVLGIVTLVTPVSPLKASEPIRVTPSGIETLVMPALPLKASSAIATTGLPTMVAGITKAEGQLPLQPVIVT